MTVLNNANEITMTYAIIIDLRSKDLEAFYFYEQYHLFYKEKSCRGKI